MLGLNPMLNLSGKDNDYIKLKRSDVFVEWDLDVISIYLTLSYVQN